MGCSSSKLPATAPVIPAASRAPPDDGQGRSHGANASSGSREEVHSSANYSARGAGTPSTRKRASSGQRSPSHESEYRSPQRDDPDGEGAGVVHATSVKASGVAISTGGAAGGAGSGSIGTNISSDTRSRKRSASGASSGRRNGSRQFVAPDGQSQQSAAIGVTGPASADGQRTRKGSVEAARPSQKLGAGGEANVAAALRSKRRGQIIAESMPVDVRIHKPVFEKSSEVRQVISAALKENVLTSSLGPDVIRDLVNATQPRDVDIATEIITQGDVGDNFYVIESGTFDILVNGAKVATFGDGTPNKSFGELALLFNSPRAASVVATTPARVWWLGRDTFRGLVATSSHEEHGRVKAALARGILSGLDTEQIERVAGAATRVRFNDGDQVIRKGAEGSVFYVILEGEVLCTNIGGGQSDNVLSKGDYFGERALIKHEPRAADVFAQGNTDLIALSREDFEAQLGGLRALLEHNLGLRLLLCVPFLGALEEADRTRLFGELRLVQYKAGRAIARRGRKLKKFRIIKEGTARIDVTGDGAAAAAGGADADDEHTLLPGQWFGEGELLADAPAQATVVAVSPVQCFELSAEAFRDLLSAVPVLCAGKNMIQDKRKITPEEAAKARRTGLKVAERVEAAAAGAASARRSEGPKSSLAAERVAVAAAGAAATSGVAVAPAPAATKSSSRRPKRKRRPMLELAFGDLEQRATLGTGTFGRVKLVVHRPTGTPYALKALQKSQIVAMRQQKNVIREKEILAVVDHPFVIKLFQTFKDKHRLYMLLELVQGGELFSRMQGATYEGREGILSPEHSRFYAACVADALAHLHERHVAYRDLKPENLLIDSAGFIKVVDFGFAKVVRDRTYTLCGTPEYLAPELISGKGHNRGVDWWALGILIFEMASGYSPYMDERDDQLRVARNIMRAELKFPEFVTSRSLQSIVRALLSRDVSKRLGMMRGGAADVRSHPFFSSIDWDALLAGKVKTPWAPKIRSTTDTTNFDKYDEDEQLERYVPEPGAAAWDRDF